MKLIVFGSHLHVHKMNYLTVSVLKRTLIKYAKEILFFKIFNFPKKKKRKHCTKRKKMKKSTIRINLHLLLGIFIHNEKLIFLKVQMKNHLELC